MQTMLIGQIVNSKLSKQGKTTLTGVFEGQPQNALVAARRFTTPAGDVLVDAPIDNAVAFNNTQTVADTYLEHLKKEKRL